MKTLRNIFMNYQRARTRTVLSGLSDRQLYDIGIKRSGIAAHVDSIFEN
jgi:uncharacterized protein YjiS (DUF1127 family)